jgi:lycopene cyclase domain-containing protein
VSRHLTYLAFELAWAAPVLALQWAVGRRRLWDRRRVLILALLVSTAYLCLADTVAISNGIWTLHSSRILGLHLGNLPLEEALFFLLTDAMVVQSVLLVNSFWRRI